MTHSQVVNWYNEHKGQAFECTYCQRLGQIIPATSSQLHYNRIHRNSTTSGVTCRDGLEDRSRYIKAARLVADSKRVDTSETIISRYPTPLARGAQCNTRVGTIGSSCTMIDRPAGCNRTGWIPSRAPPSPPSYLSGSSSYAPMLRRLDGFR